MLAVQPAGIGGADEELGSVGVRPGVGHGQGALAPVLESKVLVLKLASVDRLASSAIAIGEVTALEHELGDHTVDYQERTTQRQENITCQKSSCTSVWRCGGGTLSPKCDGGEEGIHTGAALVAESLLAGAESPEVLNGVGDCSFVELHGDTAGRGAADVDVEENSGIRRI